MEVSKGPVEDALCRICRSSEGGQLLIFGASGAERAIPDKIHECLPVKVSMKDGLPQTICGDCHSKLEAFSRFRELSRQSENKLSGLCSSESTKSDSDGSNSKTSEKEKGSCLSLDAQGVPKKKNSYAQLSEPHPEDYVLMKEETINVDNTYKTSNVMADYLIEFNNNTKVKTEAEMADRDIVMAMRRRREVLPPMWDVFERVQSEQERQQLDAKPKGSKQALRTVLKGKFSVIHRRYIVAKGAFPCSLCGRCFRFNQGQPRDGDEGEASDAESCEGMHSCAQCGCLFPTLEALQRHELTHNASLQGGELPSFCCSLCGKAFGRNEHLSRHMMSHTGGRPFQCDLCHKVFTRKEHLVRHRSTHTDCVEVPEEKPFVCDVCNVAYARRDQIAKHKKMVHNIDDPDQEPKPYVCEHCLKTFTRKEHLVRHKKIHLREMRDIPLTVNSPQVVKQVGKDTVTLEISGNMAAHPDAGNGVERMSNIIEQGRYGEVSIERKMGSQAAPAPVAAAPPPALVPLAPPVADPSYYPADGLTEEQRAQLEGFLDSSIGVEPEMMPMSFEPESRQVDTPTDEYMEEKESIDLEDLKKMPKCRICAKAFTKKNHLNRHLKRYHNLTKEQVNSGKFEMYENGETRALGDGADDGEVEDFLDDDGSPILKRPKCTFPCSVCRKTFTRKYHMYRHQKTQHGIEFPSRDQQKDEVKCSDCGLIFLTSEELNAHECTEEPDMDREPARRKPASAGGTFKCAICKSSFESHDGFKDHECKKLHRCATCGETFDKNRQLTKHMESHAATAPPATVAV